MAKVSVRLDKDRLRALMVATKATNFKAVAEAALGLAEILQTAKAAGFILILRGKDGVETEI